QPAESSPRRDAAARPPRSLEHLYSLLLARRWRRWQSITGLLAQIRQHDVLQRDVAHLPGGVEDRAIEPHEQGSLTRRMARLDDVVDAGDGGGVRARPDEQLVCAQDLVDLASELYL